MNCTGSENELEGICVWPLQISEPEILPEKHQTSAPSWKETGLVYFDCKMQFSEVTC